MAEIICFAQSKGGTGKTSSTLNIAAVLVEKGYRVLVCDLDQQSNLTISLGVNPLDCEVNTYNLLTEASATAKDAIVSTTEKIDLLSAHPDLALVESVAREKQLARKLNPIAKNYDFILLDTAPSLGIATLNALCAANWLFIPTQPEPLCVYGLNMLIDQMENVRTESNPNLDLLGFFITFYDARSKAHKEIERGLREQWEGQILKSVIKRRNSILETTLEGKSIISLRSESDLAKEYRALTEEMIKRVQ
jgi:chromosome partitioning protein